MHTNALSELVGRPEGVRDARLPLGDEAFRNCLGVPSLQGEANQHLHRFAAGYFGSGRTLTF